MKKIISLIVIAIFGITTTFASNETKTISNGTKNINNMTCDYIQVWYDDYHNMTFENWIEKERKVDLNKVKMSTIFWYDFYEDTQRFQEYLNGIQEKYNWNSYSIDIFMGIKTGWSFSIYKDGKYIYNAWNSKYDKNWKFWFEFLDYESNSYFIFSNCKEIITNAYQTNLNKSLKNTFDKINEKFKNDEEKRNAFYDNLNSKIEKLLKTKLSTKNKFIVEYIKKASLYYKQNAYEYNWFSPIENIGNTDFLN